MDGVHEELGAPEDANPAAIPGRAGSRIRPRFRAQQILAAAERLLYERSFDVVSVDEIGRAAGVSGSAIYRHFESKDEILAVLFDQAIDSLLVHLPAARDDPRDRLADLVRAHVEFATTRPRLAAIWFAQQRSLAEPYRRGYQRRQHRYFQLWIECLHDCYPQHSFPELMSAARGILALLMSDAIRPPGGVRSPDAPDLLVSIALTGLDALSTSRTPPPTQRGFNNPIPHATAS